MADHITFKTDEQKLFIAENIWYINRPFSFWLLYALVSTNYFSLETLCMKARFEREATGIQKWPILCNGDSVLKIVKNGRERAFK